MKKKNDRNLIKIIGFLLVVCIVLGKTTSVLNYKDTGGGGGWQRFYHMPQKTADVMFFGSSHAHCTVDHGLLWDQYGIAGYTLSAGSQRLDSTYYFLKEAIRVQKPKIAVVEVWGTVLDGMEYSEEAIYRNTLGMHWSKNLFEFVDYMAAGMGESSSYRNRVLCKLPIIHSRYKELSKEDFKDDLPYMRGYRGSFDIVSFETPVKVSADQKAELNPVCEEYLYKIIELAKESGTQLVFMASPYILSEEEQMRFNKTAEIAAQESIPMLDYNQLRDEIGLDYAVDFRDSDHVNNSGAAKVTDHLARFLTANYELTDHRGDSKYKDWDLNKQYLDDKRETNMLNGLTDAGSYLQGVSTLQNRTVILSLNGNYMAAGDSYYDGLAALGICYEDYQKGGVWIFENGVPTLYLSGKEYSQKYPIKDGEIYVKSELHNEDCEDTELILNGKNYSFVENGLNILIYDQDTKQVIDHAGTDIYVSFEMIREDAAE